MMDVPSLWCVIGSYRDGTPYALSQKRERDCEVEGETLFESKPRGSFGKMKKDRFCSGFKWLGRRNVRRLWIDILAPVVTAVISDIVVWILRSLVR
jgi:hypothetical protein